MSWTVCITCTNGLPSNSDAVFAPYNEDFDPNTQASNDQYTATTVGFNWIFENLTRFQLNYEIRDDQGNARVGNRTTAQFQIVF